ncbi:MAG: hypothetical protein V1740_01860 [Candidatus Woesearchaeota archaeon]
MEQQLFPQGYEQYNDLIKVASSPIKPIQRLHKVYYQFDLDEVKELMEEVKNKNSKEEFLLDSEVRFLDKFISIIKKLKDKE